MNIFKIVFVIIGTLIGAGFASGKEIYTFFYVYGIKGIFGIILSSTMICIVIYKSLKIVTLSNISTYREFLEEIFIFKNIKSKKNTKILNIINIVINIFILITFYIMIAAFGAYFKQEYNVNNIIGSSILAIISYIVLLGDIKGVVKVNQIIVPLLIVFVIILGIINFENIDIYDKIINIQEKNNSSIILSSLIYVSYNSILLMPVLIPLKKYIKSVKDIKKIGIITNIIICVLSLTIYTILLNINSDMKNLEMPVVYIVSQMSYIFKYIYGIIILSSIYTTTLSLGMSFLQNIATSRKKYIKTLIFMCISGVIFSQIGFGNLVELLYPIFGYIGLYQIYRIYKI